jgi:hypothetical protein
MTTYYPSNRVHLPFVFNLFWAHFWPFVFTVAKAKAQQPPVAAHPEEEEE